MSFKSGRTQEETTFANVSNKRASQLSKSLNISEPPASPSPRDSSAWPPCLPRSSSTSLGIR